MKLKTLKDIGGCNCGCNLKNNNELRQEAIKRAKYYKKQIDCEEEPKECAYWEGKYDECIDFANLTEDDLKENNQRSEI